MRAWPWMIALGLPLLTSGCATHALWTKAPLDAWNEPASNPRVRLFDASQRRDYLVVYDEYSERYDSVRPRAYLLNQNQQRVTQGRKPHFVSARAPERLAAVPIFQNPPGSGTNFPPAIYAVIATNQQSFAIYSNQSKTDFSLPVYNDGRGRIYRIALTPVAVTADITIVGGILGCWFIYGLAESGYSVTVR